MLGPPATHSYRGVVSALINELAAALDGEGPDGAGPDRAGPDRAGPDRAKVVLVLDDYHLIDSRPVHESLTFLIEHLPAGLHVALATRSDPPLGLPRLRARGELAELRVAELRFAADEAAALLQETAGPGLAAAAVKALTARTEGWAAGLQLAGLSLRGQADIAGRPGFLPNEAVSCPTAPSRGDADDLADGLGLGEHREHVVGDVGAGDGPAAAQVVPLGGDLPMVQNSKSVS